MALILVSFSGASRPPHQSGAAVSGSSRNYDSAAFVPGAAPAEVQRVIVSEDKTQVTKLMHFLELMLFGFHEPGFNEVLLDL